MCRSLPADVPGLAGLDAGRAAFKRLLAQINFAETEPGGVRRARVGAGRFLLGDDLRRLLAQAGTRREALVERGLHRASSGWRSGAGWMLRMRPAGR